MAFYLFDIKFGHDSLKEETPLQIIKIDATGWQKPTDFYDAILTLLGAPDWHSRNLNALTESMIWGGINAMEAPYTVQISAAQDLPPAVVQAVKDAEVGVQRARLDCRARTGRDVEVYFQIVD